MSKYSREKEKHDLLSMLKSEKIKYEVKLTQLNGIKTTLTRELKKLNDEYAELSKIESNNKNRFLIFSSPLATKNREIENKNLLLFRNQTDINSEIGKLAHVNSQIDAINNYIKTGNILTTLGGRKKTIKTRGKKYTKTRRNRLNKMKRDSLVI